MTWTPPIKEVTVPNMNRLVKVAKRDINVPGQAGKIFNVKTGQIAEWDPQLVQTWENWEFITNNFYPLYKDGKYIGPEEIPTCVLIGCKNPAETKKCISCIHDKSVFSCMQYMFLNKMSGIYANKNSEEFKELQYKREMEE